MISRALIAICCCLLGVLANEETPRIIIVGAGLAGIGAGTKLLENGFENITILEAENRIGGRVYTAEIGGYPVDMGGQWVHGENNSVFEMVWPLGLLQRSDVEIEKNEIFDSTGAKLPDEMVKSLLDYREELNDMVHPDSDLNKTAGEWIVEKHIEYFKQHPIIDPLDQDALLTLICQIDLPSHGADSLTDVTMDREYIPAVGDELVNWKDKTYGTIIDILLKKFPNPAEELPFRNKTVLNAEVSKINYDNPDGLVRVILKNGEEYTADHVIVTPSLGVLKAEHETMFNPSLPETKVNAVDGFGMGTAVKIYLFYPQPWWATEESFDAKFYWKNEDRKKMEENKLWQLGLFNVLSVEHKPGLLCCWVVGQAAKEVEALSDEEVLSGTKEILNRFLGKSYNVTEPSAMLRSQWYTNKHFRGTYSYHDRKADQVGALHSHLAEPIIVQGKPRIMFAGEATSLHQSATVHGAIESGWREADRLIEIYKRRDSEVATEQLS